LREWASGRSLDADKSGIYAFNSKRPNSRRRIARDPSRN
jgi:hypothetical protein